MKIYWRYKDVPELADLPWRERSIVARKCFWKCLRYWQCWAAFLVYFGCVMAGVVVGEFLTKTLGYPKFVQLLCIIVGVLIGAPIWCSVATERLRPHFREYRASRHQTG